MDNQDKIQDKINQATALLEAIIEDRSLLAGLDPDQRTRFLVAAGRVSKPDKAARRKLARHQQRDKKVTRRQADRALLDQTGIRQLRANPIFETPRRQGDAPKPPLGTLQDQRLCYICHARYAQVHWFYDRLCPACGELNHSKRSQTADLSGRVALVTGARVKIGYQAAIMLLRAGARVLVVTRFPVDAAARYAREPDFGQWEHRLAIHGLDLRHIPSVEAFCAQLRDSEDRLDFLVNNACQTVRRPPAFYRHMMAAELEADPTSRTRALVTSQRSGPALSSAALSSATLSSATLSSATLSQVPLVADDHLDPTALFPAEQLDADLQQVDLRRVNSWRLRLHEVPTVELLEVHLVNAVAPFLLNARLKPLMTGLATADQHIVNVSAMEGQFYRTYKSDRHPHTNMAKASLNMMTRTSAQDYVAAGIHMNSVDTGWVTDEDPAAHAQDKRDMHDFHPPLDIVDGAARILDPILAGLNSGQHLWGKFLKDYQVTDW